MALEPVRIAWMSPLPPLKTGVASYAAMLLPSMANRIETTVVVDQAEYMIPAGCQVLSIDEYRGRRGEFDAVLYHLGNNPHHEFIYREAMEHAGVIVLHDLVLHHLIVEMTLARGYEQEYVDAMTLNHGAPGAALARGRANGFHHEIANFLFPASKVIADRSRAVIVHNRYAAEALRRMHVSTPVSVIDHPFVAPPPVSDSVRQTLRQELGFAAEDRLVGVFGFVTAAKRPETVFAAFAAASARDSRLRLVIVGEAAPNVDLASLAASHGLAAARWKSTGYVNDEEFDACLATVDRVISLRYPSAGETSGALLRVFHAGKPVAISDYAQFSEIPNDVATKIPLDDGEVPSLVRFLLDSSDGESAVQRKFLEEHAAVTETVDQYLRALQSPPAVPPTRSERLSPIPLFPSLSVSKVNSLVVDDSWSVSVFMTNHSEFILRAATYGTPEYRLIAT
ncbi:MAG: glycosyltransferase, partial [Acidobacteriota bacterium]